LGVRPALGGLDSEADVSGVILSHHLWAQRFHADVGLVGRTLVLDGAPRRVMGVLPKGVRYPAGVGRGADLYTFLNDTPAARDNFRAVTMFVVARLRPGVSLEQAQLDTQRVAARQVTIRPLHELVVGPNAPRMILVLVAVGVLLLVGCLNVASLLIARAITRIPEFATRMSLGASPARLSALVSAEGFLLAAFATAAALGVSSWGLDVARASLPPGLPRVEDISIDGRVVLVSAIAALLTGATCSIVPAWLASRTDLVALTKPAAVIGGGERRNSILSLFLVADIAFVASLLVVATLVVATFVVVTTRDLGFARKNVVALPFLRMSHSDDGVAASVVHAQLVERVKAYPGVQAAAIVSGSGTPMDGSSVRYSLEIPGFGVTPRSDWLETKAVSPEYFDVMGIRVVGGRRFDLNDRAGAPAVLIIDEEAARRFFTGRDPVGQVVRHRGLATIVGVVRAVLHDGPESAARPSMYLPLAQQRSMGGFVSGSLVVLAAGDPRPIVPALQNVVRLAIGVEAGSPHFMGDQFSTATAARRFNAILLGVLGVLAILIGTTGVYGTMLFFVSRRVPVIGLHMALGATPRDVLYSVLREAFIRVSAGVAIGLAGAAVASNTIQAWLFGVSATDGGVYLAVGLFVAAAAMFAAYLPARTGSKLNPITALRLGR
jgi:putative ABC transport system permease protein